MSNDAEQVSAQHGGGGYRHVQITYSYYAVAVAQINDAQRRQAGRAELNRHAGCTQAMGRHPTGSARDSPTDPEIPIRLLLPQPALQVRGRQGASAGKWYGIASIGIETQVAGRRRGDNQHGRLAASAISKPQFRRARHAKDRAFVRHDGTTRNQRSFRRIRRHRRYGWDRRHRRPRHREKNPDPARQLPDGSLRGALYPNLIGVFLRARIRQIDQRQHQYTHSFTRPVAMHSPG